MNTIAMFSGQDLLVFFLIMLLLFGAKKLPELARGMGQAVKEFNKAKDEIERELTKPATEVTAQPAPNKLEYNPAPATVPPAAAPAAPTLAETKPAEESAPQTTTQQLL